MKFDKVKSLFSKEKPYLTIVESFNLDDFEVKVIRPQSKDISDVTKASQFSRQSWAGVYLFPKEEVINSILENLGEPYRMFKHNDYFNGGVKDYGRVEKWYTSKSVRSPEIQFRGIRSIEGKKKKYLKSFNDFSENFETSIEDIIQELLKEANEGLVSLVESTNEDYIRSHTELYTTTKYERAWGNYFEKEPKFGELSERKKEVNDKLAELKAQISKIEGQERLLKLEIVKKDLETADIPSELKEDIKKKLDDGKAWSNRSLRPHRFG